MMDEFNQAMNKLESSLTANAQAAANAQSTANTAKSTANTALASKPYVTGTYTGDGGTKSIHLGFRPSFVIISGMKEIPNNTDTTQFDRVFVMTGGNNITKRVKFTSTGFTVYPKDVDNYFYPYLNQTDRVYDYIAFK